MPNHVLVVDESTVRMTFEGDQNEGTFAPVLQEVEILVKEAELTQRSLNILVDVTHTGKVTLGVRQLASRKLREWPLNRVAIFGGSIYLRHLASLVILATGNKRARLFSTEKEALSWLNA